MRQMRKKDPGSVVVIIITLVLFIAAVFFQGMTHDMLLEAGVFLVSVKLIIVGYRNRVSFESVQERLDEIKEILRNCPDESRYDPDHLIASHCTLVHKHMEFR